MFDDQPLQNTGQVPSNLPTSEPEDVFAGVDKAPAVGEPGIAPTPPPSAVSAGVLKPKESQPEPAPKNDFTSPSIPTPSGTPVSQPFATESASGGAVPPARITPPAPGMDESYHIKEPIGKKSIITWIIIFVFLIILGGGSAWVYFTFMRGDTSSGIPIIEDDDAKIVEEKKEEPVNIDKENDVATDEEKEQADEQILFGDELIDTDGDGLDDVTEAQFQTDSLNWDTDGDGLSDFEEITVWETSPLQKDSDADGFEDGVEIKNGYNPIGDGKLFDLPEDEGSVTTTESK